VKGDQGAFARELVATGIECRETDDDAMRLFVPERNRWAHPCSSWRPKAGRPGADT